MTLIIANMISALNSSLSNFFKIEGYKKSDWFFIEMAFIQMGFKFFQADFDVIYHCPMDYWSTVTLRLGPTYGI